MQHFRKMQNYYLQCALQSKNMTRIIGHVIHIYNYNGRELILQVRESSLSLILQNENIFRNLSSTLLYQKLFQWVQSIKNGYICMSLSVKFLPRVFISNYFIKAFERQRRIVGVKKKQQLQQNRQGCLLLVIRSFFNWSYFILQIQLFQETGNAVWLHFCQYLASNLREI